jgi:archaellum biogenesis protein FlaJ (TadC family)
MGWGGNRFSNIFDQTWVSFIFVLRCVLDTTSAKLSQGKNRVHMTYFYVVLTFWYSCIVIALIELVLSLMLLLL